MLTEKNQGKMDDMVKDMLPEIMTLLGKGSLTLTQVHTSLPAKSRPSKKELLKCFDVWTTENRFFSWAPRKNTVYYCLSSPEEVVSQTVLSSLESGDLTPKQLAVKIRYRLPLFSAAHLDGYLAPLMEDGLIYYHPPKTSKDNPHYSQNTLNIKDYLGRVIKEFNAASRKLLTTGFSSRQILIVLAGELGIRIKSSQEPSHTKILPPENIGSQIVAAMEKIEPDARAGMQIYIRDLRRSLAIQKIDFDQAVINLAREGKVYIYLEDDPLSMPERERQELVRDETGAYYSVIVFRKEV